MPPKTSRANREISSPRQIRALISPVRQDIVDTVEAAGPCSVADLACLLGMPADGLYYHIRCLTRAGLLKAVNSKSQHGRSAVRLETATSQWVKYRPENPANRRAVVRLAGSMLRNAQRQFGRAFRPDVAIVSGPQRNLWAARARAFLSPADVRRANALLQQLLAVFEPSKHPPATGSLHEITFVLAPVLTARRAVRPLGGDPL
ncbi:MAG: helix-turn-helix domain-containing protein [Bryobacteraceae bacterium]